MKHLINFNLFEGIFSLPDENSIGEEVLSVLRKSDINIETTNSGYLVKNIKLDNNIGYYDLNIMYGNIDLLYYGEKGVFKFKHELKCLSQIKNKIFNLIKNKYGDK